MRGLVGLGVALHMCANCKPVHKERCFSGENMTLANIRTKLKAQSSFNKTDPKWTPHDTSVSHPGLRTATQDEASVWTVVTPSSFTKAEIDPKAIITGEIGRKPKTRKVAQSKDCPLVLAFCVGNLGCPLMFYPNQNVNCQSYPQFRPKMALCVCAVFLRVPQKRELISRQANMSCWFLVLLIAGLFLFY